MATKEAQLRLFGSSRYIQIEKQAGEGMEQKIQDTISFRSRILARAYESGVYKFSTKYANLGLGLTGALSSVLIITFMVTALETPQTYGVTPTLTPSPTPDMEATYASANATSLASNPPSWSLTATITPNPHDYWSRVTAVPTLTKTATPIPSPRRQSDPEKASGARNLPTIPARPAGIAPTLTPSPRPTLYEN